jgi:hypothetical protein
MPDKILMIAYMQYDMVTGENRSAGSMAVVPRIAREIAEGGYGRIVVLNNSGDEEKYRLHRQISEAIDLWQSVTGKTAVTIARKPGEGFLRSFELNVLPYISKDDELVLCGVYLDREVLSTVLTIGQVLNSRLTVRRDLCASTTAENFEAAVLVLSANGVEIDSLGMDFLIRRVLTNLNFIQCYGNKWTSGTQKVSLLPGRLEIETEGNPRIQGYRYESVLIRDNRILFRMGNREEILVEKENRK